MSYRYEKDTDDIVISGFEQGIASSPHKGIASIRNANISTESGEIMCNFQRFQQSANNSTVTLSASDGTHLKVAATTLVPYINQTLKLSSSSISGLNSGIYWVENISLVGGFYFITLSSAYDEVHHSNTIDTGFGSTGTVTAQLLGLTSTPVASYLEQYFDGSVIQTRYYVAETSGDVWVLDTAYSNSRWYLIDTNTTPNTLIGLTGMAVINGCLFVFQSQISSIVGVYYKITCILGLNPNNPVANTSGWGVSSMSGFLNTSVGAQANPHFALVGHEASMSYTDGPYIATLIPLSTSSSLGANTPQSKNMVGGLNANVFSYGVCTQSTYTITSTVIFSGGFPVAFQTITFVTDNTIPSGLARDVVYYVCSGSETNAVAPNPQSGEFSIKTTPTGTSALNTGTGAAGNLYFNSFNPACGTINGIVYSGNNSPTNSGGSTFLGVPAACSLPQFEVTTALAELNTNLIIGCTGNSLYVWDQGIGGTNDISPQSYIPMAESNCTFLLTVNNNVYDFRGQKGNVYVTSGSAASVVLSVSDYLAGTPGNPTSYIEPYFTWGLAFFQRGRIFFSISDNNGNAGGIYSFVPSFFNSVSGEDAGISLRLENYNSYSTYAGLANVLFPNQNQSAIGVQYFSAWSSGTGTFGIDTSGTTPYTNGDTIIETDIIPLGTILGSQTKNPSNIEFKLAAPLASGESVAIKYRLNLTDTWSPAGTLIYGNGNVAAGSISGYYSPLSFNNSQWLQLQIILTSTTSTPSFTRLTELRIRNT